MSPLHDELAAQREAIRLRQLKAYVGYLERGAATHAAYGQIASKQAVTQERILEDMAGAMQTAAEDEEPELGAGRVAYQVAAQTVELFNVQASIHTLGLSVCLAALAGLAAQGVEVPDPPRLPEVDLGE